MPRSIRRSLFATAVAVSLTFLTGPVGAAEQRLERPGGPITYKAEGAGPAIVLIPSLGRGQEDFDVLAPMLVAGGFRVLRPEPRGIGGSTPTSAGATLHDLGNDIAALIEVEHAAPAVIAGHAFGNWVARVAAYDHPHLSRGVAMLAAVLGTEVEPGIRRSITASFDTDLSDAERLEHLRRAYFAPGNDAAVWLSGWYKPVALAERDAQAATRDKEWLRAGDRQPLLYLAAAQDAIAPPPTAVRVVEALGPQARLVVVQKAGHALVPEQPRAVAEALLGFARSLPAVPAPQSGAQ